jgi:hypothetical protein
VRLANLIDNNFSKNPQMTILLDETVESEVEAQIFGLSLTRCYLKDMLSGLPQYTFVGSGEGRQCRLALNLDRHKVVGRLVSLRAVAKTLCKLTGLTLNLFTLPFMNGPETTWQVGLSVPLALPFWQSLKAGLGLKRLTEEVVADNLVYNLCHSLVIHGIPEIENFVAEPVKINTERGIESRWSITTLGSNLLKVMRLPKVDVRRTCSNDISEMCDVLGMHAARKSLENEFMMLMQGLLDSRHVKLIARVMASDLVIKGMKIKQVGQTIPPLQRAAYEQGPKQMVEYCARGERDEATTICGAALANKYVGVGTGYNLAMIPVSAWAESKLHPRAATAEPLQADLIWSLEGSATHQAETHSNLVPTKARESFDRLPLKICDYAFSPKVDGVRYMLVFFHNRQGLPVAAMVDREFQVWTVPAEGLPLRFFSGTVLDGELVRCSLNPGVEPREPKKVADHSAYLVFDCLMSCGNRCHMLRYDQRLELAREVVYRLNTKDLSSPFSADYPVALGVDLPFALPVSLPGREKVSSYLCPAGKLPFSLTVKPLFNLNGLLTYTRLIVDHLPFKVDGYVLSNLYDPAYPFRVKKDSLFKWKPRCDTYSENTVDFVVTRCTQPPPPLYRTFSNHPRAKNGWKYPLSMAETERFRTCEPSRLKDQVSLWVPWGRPTNRKHQGRFHFACGWWTLGPECPFVENQVYECRWNYKTLAWEVCRPRQKAANQWGTVMATLKNIVEDLQLEELVMPT